ncbi:alpha/beta fold hydrolase [Microlunatus flavus]|uniref:Pimeloyl-ACP methyl ester carboxylesterase n=1 Tax=Microlunatus flavus TaxID=1036181 RepID=A0A1H9FSW6_9ACTN|nr:alpha/beta hydrolase [Microlunatus flavus]SEQ41010.1 Pimeloyl-ACP methyl ester carboxylesterase [Microlunatus flavus]
MGKAAVGDRRPPEGFTEQRTDVDGVMINYVRGGEGPTLVLLHGYPQTWYAWHAVMPELAQRYTVVAPDLRGAGDSDAPAGGYDKKTLAGDVHGLLVQLGLDRNVRVVGHDIGSMVAYTYAAQHSDDVERLVFCEAVIPDEGIYSMPVLTPQGPGHWNFGLFQVPDFPESLVRGRELGWVRGYMLPQAKSPEAIDERSLEEYARCLAADEAHLTASFGPFRALVHDMADMAAYARTPLTMPVLAIGASDSLGASVGQQLARYAEDVRSVVIEDAGHYLFDEQPQELSGHVLPFLD